MSKEPVTVIIPTMDNLQQLSACIHSIVVTRLSQPMQIVIVNNGKIPVEQYLSPFDLQFCKVVTPDKNLGWTGGLEEGLKYADTPYVLFANDDIFVPRSSTNFLKNMVRVLDLYPAVGAIGPTSNVVSGWQNIWADLTSADVATQYLIGFCMLVRREALDKAGGIHHMEYGGDDLDLSIRLRKAGYLLIVKRDEFVYHHGFQTGERVHGAPDKANGWNSREMIENTSMELIRKHGFMEWWNTTLNRPNVPTVEEATRDLEGEVIRKYVSGDVVLELGCGATKTVPTSIGVDIIPKGQLIPTINAVSVADIQADVCERLPFSDYFADTIIARHVLEHVLDPVAVLTEWLRVLKPKGRLIVACPDERLHDTIPMNPQHLHAFTSASLNRLAFLLGYKTIAKEDTGNQVSFVNVMEIY